MDTVNSNRQLSPEEMNHVVARNEGQNGRIYSLLLENGINVQPIKRHYGGAKVLAQYKAYVEIPYQVSTMKVVREVAVFELGTPVLPL